MSDFFTSRFGGVRSERWRWRRRLTDAVFDIALLVSGGRRRMKAQSRVLPKRRVLVLGVAVPTRMGDMDRVVAALRRTRHEVITSIVPMADMGKFENLTTALAQVREPLASFDWIVLTDDDIAFPAHFLDDFLGLAELGGLKLAQPAHRFRSHTSYEVTQRRWGALVHATKFVEIGPLTAVHRDVIDALLPFPQSRWAWGLDVQWAQLAHDNHWRIGVVDGTPIRHLRPVGGSYDTEAARQEGTEFLARHNVTLSRRDCFGESHVVTAWRGDV